MSDAAVIDAALERGRTAVKTERFEPVGVEHRGRLVALIKDRGNDNVERLHVEPGGQVIYYMPGKNKDDKLVTHVCRDKSLKKIVKAMLCLPRQKDQDALIQAAWDTYMSRRGGPRSKRKGRKVRRGRG